MKTLISIFILLVGTSVLAAASAKDSVNASKLIQGILKSIEAEYNVVCNPLEVVQDDAETFSASTVCMGKEAVNTDFGILVSLTGDLVGPSGQGIFLRLLQLDIIP